VFCFILIDLDTLNYHIYTRISNSFVGLSRLCIAAHDWRRQMTGDNSEDYFFCRID
jgi:hypothetical protein